MGDSLRDSDTQVRRDALDVSRSYVFQAPAGSGKTELLIQRYLRLLAVVDDPEEIVAITFTRKAAQEMRNRVSDALIVARNEVLPGEEHRKVTYDAARQALARDNELRWDLVANPRRMRIQTLDSFCAGIARSLPVSSGLGGISRITADEEMRTLQRDAAVATLDWLASEGAIGDAVREVLGHLDNNVSLYVSHLSRMLASRDQWLSLVGSGVADEGRFDVARKKLEASIAGLIDEQLARVKALLPESAEGVLVSSIDYGARQLRDAGAEQPPWADIRSLPAFAVSGLSDWQAVCEMLLTQGGTIRKTVNKNNGFPPKDDGQKQGFLELLGALRKCEGLEHELERVRALPPPRYSDEQWSVLLALFRLLPVAVAELRRSFAEQSVCDHTEVALAAASALGTGTSPGDLAMMLDYRIRHLLVDEMQDTSLGQYDLLAQLVSGWEPGDGRTLFCVGDPMQSIYRFRDAEVGQFLLIREHGIADVRPDSCLLRQNFRSGENIVHWFNTVFGQVMPTVDDIAAGAIAYADSIPTEPHSGQGDVQLHPLINNNLEAEATYCADLIGNLLQKHEGESITVLVRSRTQLAQLLPILQRVGIEYHAVDIDRLTDLPEIIDLLGITRALCHDLDRAAWLGLLHGPLVGMSWRDILTLVAGDKKSSIMELAADALRVEALGADGRKRLQGFVETMQEVLAHPMVERLRDRVERCWYALGGPATLESADQADKAYQYLDVLGRLELAGTIADVRELETLLDREHVSRNPGDNCRLQIMTMHKAKGLQFDHTVLFGLGRRTRGEQKSVLSWLSLPGKSDGDMIISPVGPRWELENDKLHQFIESTEGEKQKNELDRLLYVACTRAKKSLHLVGNVNLTAKGELKEAVAGSLLHRLWPAVRHEYEAVFATLDEAGQGADDADQPMLVPAIARRFPKDWSAPAAPALPVAGTSESERTSDAPEVEFYWVGTLARYAGTIVHRWLQRIALPGAAVGMPDHDAVSRRWAAQLGVAPKDLDSVCARVEDALKGILSDEKGRWLLQGPGSAELPLTGIWQGDVQSIVIDRVRIDEDGTHWIVDYKTSTHEGGDIAGFLAQERERYRAQIDKYEQIYAGLHDVPIKRALYFPLLQQFCEI